MTAIRAIVFDLYGTVLHLRSPEFQNRMGGLVTAPRRDWVRFLREELLVRRFGSREEIVEAALARFPAANADAARAAALEVLAREIDSVEPEPAARSVLGFLRRRGLKLAVLTNSASPYREPLARSGLEEDLDAVLFSCDLGARKPEPATYAAVLSALGVRADESLMIGDSLANDVEGPAAAGMASLLIARSGHPASIGRFADLAWLAGLERGAPELLVEAGRRVELGGVAGSIARLDLLPDTLQGRYNLVATADVVWDDGLRERVYLKRFRHPEAVRVEQFARRLHGEIGVATNRVAVLPGAEPLLLARAVSGEKLGAEHVDPDLAFEIGRQIASGFVFANADLRPRNAFLTRFGARPGLTLLDYEYALFDRALDLSDLPERFDPRALARRSESELLARGQRRVLTRATIQRARRAFFDARAVGEPVLAAYREGWREVHQAARAAAARLEEMLHERIEQEPPLVIGTEAYRRALLPLDVRDLLERVALDPDRACDLCF